MQVSLIQTPEHLAAVRPDWEAVYAADPHSSVFMSWEWMSGWTRIVPCTWLILAARYSSGSGYAAFMPLGMQFIRADSGRVLNKLVMGGNPWSDSTGFLCLPQQEEALIPVFAGFIKNYLRWDIFDMRNLGDPRLPLFLKRFSPHDFVVRAGDSIPCPHVALPTTWEQYLRESLGSCTRRHLKYAMRKVERHERFRAVATNAENAERQIETLLALWRGRWGRETREETDRFRILFRSCLDADSLCLTTLWLGEEPLAAEAAFLDRKLKIFWGYTTAFNPAFSSLSPGNVMTGFHIRTAISEGFRIYDFGAGGEPYKYNFGTRERFNRNITIQPLPLSFRIKNRLPRPVRRWGKAVLARIPKLGPPPVAALSGHAQEAKSDDER